MQAKDVMVFPVVTTTPSASVKEAAELLLGRGISAVPVVDDDGELVGIISEGDLIHRAEAGTERRRSWWLRLFTGGETLAQDYIQAHATKVADLMKREVVTASPDTPLHEVAALLERNGIKRVPILADGRLVGIVSRANLIQAVAASRGEAAATSADDQALRETILARLNEQPWASLSLINITVSGGVVDLWGFCDSAAQWRALHIAIEAVPGVRAVNDNLQRYPIGA